jgi:hypothetical protein
MTRVDTHLLDVGGSVDEVDKEVADWPIASVGRHERTTALSIRGKLLDRTGIGVGYEIHAEGSEHLARSSLNLDQQREIVPARSPDDLQVLPL